MTKAAEVMKAGWILIAMATAGVSGSACSFRQEHPQLAEADGGGASSSSTGSEGGGSTATRKSGYAEIERMVLTPKCVTCHDKQEPVLTSYAEVFAVREEIRNEAIVEKAMPPEGQSGLTAAELDALADWLDRGAPEVGEVEDRGGAAGGASAPGSSSSSASTSASSSSQFPSEPTPVPNPEPEPTVEPAPEETSVPVDMVQVAPGWKEIRSKLFQPYCVKCHGGKEPRLESREQVVRVLDDVRRVVLVEKTMPRGNKKPSEEALHLLEMWIASGGPQEPVLKPAPSPTVSPVACTSIEPIIIISPSPVPAPSPLVSASNRPVHWDQVWTKVLQPKCSGCHEGDDPIGKIDLTHKETIRSEFMAFILQMAVITSDMPPEDEEPLTKEEKQMLADWAVDGMPD